MGACGTGSIVCFKLVHLLVLASGMLGEGQLTVLVVEQLPTVLVHVCKVGLSKLAYGVALQKELPQGTLHLMANHPRKRPTQSGFTVKYIQGIPNVISGTVFRRPPPPPASHYTLQLRLSEMVPAISLNCVFLIQWI